MIIIEEKNSDNRETFPEHNHNYSRDPATNLFGLFPNNPKYLVVNAWQQILPANFYCHKYHLKTQLELSIWIEHLNLNKPVGEEHQNNI